jgi:hypothetical protein
MRQQPQPFAQKNVDLIGAEAVTDGLQTLGICAAEDTIVERFERYPLVHELALGIFMTIQTKLRIKRKVAAEFEKEQPEIPITA